MSLYLACLKYCVRPILCWNNSFFCYFVQFDSLKFQRFCFPRNSCHSFSTSSFSCKHRFNHCIDLLTGQKILVHFSSNGSLYIKSVETIFGLWPFPIIFKEQPTNSGLKIQKWLDWNITKIGKKTFYFR